MVIFCAWCKEFQGFKQPMEDKSGVYIICHKCLNTLADKDKLIKEKVIKNG